MAESPQKVEPAPRPGGKNSWPLAASQKQRVSESRMGILLACCLLVALGFVAYRKFNERSRQPASGSRFQSIARTEGDGEAAASTSEGPDATDAPGTEDWFTNAPPPPESTAAAKTFASDIPFGQGEPAFPASAVASAAPEPPFDAATTQQSRSLKDSDDAAWNPFAGSAPLAAGGPEEVGEREPETPSDPFSTIAASTVDDGGAWSSDPPSQPTGSAVAASVQPERIADSTVSRSPPERESSPQPDGPTLELFDLDAEPIPSQPASRATAAGSPWDEPVNERQGRDAQQPAPLLLEPQNAQAMQDAGENPFAAQSSRAERLEPVRETAVPSADAWPGRTAPAPGPLSLVPASEPAQPSTAGEQQRPGFSPFPGHLADNADAAAESIRPSAFAQDPFSPASDVRQATSETEVIVHQVRPGENFWSISQQHYGTGSYFTALAAFNKHRIPDPRRMRPGMKVLVPQPEVLARQFPQLVGGSAARTYIPADSGPFGFTIGADGRPQYRVAPGDTLSGIAARHLGRASRWMQIYGMNRDQLTDAHSLKTGMLLRLPADAAQVTLAPETAAGR